jgi:5-methylcytosine-specific restriction endonuclease McrA
VKRCNRCGENKPLDEFPPRSRKNARDGRYGYCRDCTRILGRERSRKWRKRNPERAKQANQRSRAALKERDPDYHRRWYRANIDSERERARRVMREYRKRYPERIKEQRRAFRARHPDRIRRWEAENTHRRRALMKRSSPETAAHIEQLFTEPCAYCGATENITIDHIVPLSRGGRHEPANLAPACVTCNCSKGAKLVDEWLGSASD